MGLQSEYGIWPYSHPAENYRKNQRGWLTQQLPLSESVTPRLSLNMPIKISFRWMKPNATVHKQESFIFLTFRLVVSSAYVLAL